MARNVFFFDDDLQTQRAFAAQLKVNGYDLQSPASLGEAETFVDQGCCDLVVFSGGSGSPAWQICQALEARYPWLPFLYVLVNDSEIEPHLKSDELHRTVRPLSSREAFQSCAEELIRIGDLHRRLAQLTQAQASPTALDQMFTQLDAAHIIDKVLHYFGTRLEVKNIHWVLWRELPHLLGTDSQILGIELSGEGRKSPRLMSYLDTEVKQVIDLLQATLKVDDVAPLALQQHRSAQAADTDVLYVAVTAASDQRPLGCLMIEGGGATNNAPHILQTMKLLGRFIEFGLSHWETTNLSMTDDLTDLYNQRYLATALENEINRAHRSKQAFSVLFMDLDYFKMVNDTRGHWIGSKVLREIGKLLRSCVRSCDLGFRYGGDEFVVILPGTDTAGAQIVAERIRKAVEEARFLIDGHDLRLTVSIGLASYPQHARTKEQILQLADQAMYYGKHKSRNIVYIAS